ncbi:PHP domain-containing protein [Enterobacter hormaechei]|uniref:PHP domain-containing protein n=1 Tax=Enterobacter hormaechei TaxID=158836 RepID=UPI001BE0CF4B|nr:PHP domain-containing protein [Enterobacter hormaechei]MBT1743304.1 PHP domain-containing protein [Enterobacter hormaechei subsp. xiangfangensis]MCW4831634.1 PHP domain-containing protein [Enterobacter hormaechei subsp. xiangfangensis]MCW4966769.1 PHP domain-containing protein [Enterobacter hormaechei subsp. xiangfangensis]HCM9490792.1 PHP domain-containing protein [Enterobacter hormaechei subsp. xiangfangensis]
MKALMVRTDFSLGESALKAENAVKIARDAGYTAVISADSMNIASVIPLQRAAGDDMAVICGVKLNVVDDPTYEHRARLAKESGGCMESLVRDRSYCFTALIKNEQGYRDVCELMTLANKREQFYFVPRLALDQLAAAYAKGNIILMTSDIGSVFQRRDFAKIIGTLVTAGGRDNFYSVVYPHPTPFYDQINVRAMKVASALKIEPVAFYPAYYEAVDDADIKDIAHMVTNNIKIDQPHRLRIPHQRDNAVNGRRHLLEALKAFSVRMDVPVTAAMASTTQDTIIEACTWRWHELPPALPKMADDEPATLMKLAVAGLRKRLTTKEFGYTPPASEHRVYVDRLKYEMDTLTRQGFCGYFLMVRDLMNHSRETGIPVGPGRGSSAGSLVAWCIGITNVDPIRHGLLFERFINPERLDLPDADLDFSQARRHEVIGYLNERYGEDYVAGIPNFTYLGAASALRDTARIYGVDAADMAVRESLQKVGAFASIEPGSLPATDPERLRDQAELMGNLVIDAVKASRPFEMNPKRSAEVNVLMTRMAAEMGLGDDLIRPSIGIKPKIMVILDNANGNDGRTGYFMENGYDDFKAKLLTAGDLRMGDLYVTGVCKKVKDKEKDYTKDEIGQFTDFMREEINLVRPTYVLTCGSRATSLFNNKSKPSDLVGRKEYLPELDVTVFYGFNPNILYFRPEEGEKLEAILAEVAETISK